jgi:hypothetical protein
LEPVFYGALPSIVWKNILTAYAVKGVIDLSGGSGEGCKAAMSLRKPCLAFCFNDTHVRLLFDHLVDWMLASMTDTKTVFYNANYVAYKKGAATAVATPAAPAGATPAAKKAAAKPESTKRRRSESPGRREKNKKKNRKASSSSSSSSCD